MDNKKIEEVLKGTKHTVKTDGKYIHISVDGINSDFDKQASIAHQLNKLPNVKGVYRKSFSNNFDLIVMT